MSKKQFFFFSFFLFFFFFPPFFVTAQNSAQNSLAPNFHDFDCYQKKFSQKTLEKKIFTYLQKNEQIEDHYKLTQETFCLYKTLADKKNDRPEYLLVLRVNDNSTLNAPLNASPLSTEPLDKNLAQSLHPINSLQPTTDLEPIKDLHLIPATQEKTLPLQEKIEQIAPLPKKEEIPLGGIPLKRLVLKGKKIAIDPGHLGGMWAGVEQRKFHYDNISFDEGTLTFLTAKKLQVLLEKLGAIVFLTRDSIGKGAFPLSFYEWKEKNPSSLPDKLYFHQTYNRLDLLARAEKINEFHPDLTLIIHFNAHPEEKKPSTLYNYHLAFVSGSFRKQELDDPISRYEFLRLLLTDDVEKSIKLSSLVLENLEKTTKISPIQESDAPVYLKSACLKIQKGLYSRNLALTRLVHSPLCYGEVFCQNNLLEAKKLNLKDSFYSSRLDSVAKAYCNAILQFFEEEGR